jgi:hypothetical protein
MPIIREDLNRLVESIAEQFELLRVGPYLSCHTVVSDTTEILASPIEADSSSVKIALILQDQDNMTCIVRAREVSTVGGTLRMIEALDDLKRILISAAADTFTPELPEIREDDTAGSGA